MLFRKPVDQSLLEAGTTLPLDIQNKLMQAIGVQLKRGEKQIISIVIEGASYEALLTYVDFNPTYANRDVIQIRYSKKSPICITLNNIFKHTAEYIHSHKSKDYDDKKRIIIPEDQREYIDVYAVSQNTLEFKCITKKSPGEMKDKFFKYIGGPTDLSGYQRSYKLVFFKVFFENSKDGYMDCNSLADGFKDYYLARKKRGLVSDANVDRVIENIESSSTNAVLNVIVQNPFNAINKQGFFTIDDTSGIKRFKLASNLFLELSEDDVKQILELVEKKLVLYFSRIDRGIGMGKLKEFVERFMNEYVKAKQGSYADHPFGNYIRNDVPSIFYDSGLVNRHEYLVTGSVGQGNWALVPWVGIFDKSITTSATKGVYIVYLLDKDGNSLYLTFNQGCTEIRNTHSKRETIQIMRDRAQEIASRIDSRGFETDFTIDLGEGLTELAEMYAKGTIFYKKYLKENIPDEVELENDLAKMMDIYREYANKQVDQVVVKPTGGEEEVSTKETIENIKKYIASRGFTYEESLIENFFLSLKSKPFVILAGTSGTGKTRLVKLFAEAVGATSSNGRYKMVSVRPDWSDSSDLFGHVDLNNRFVRGDIIDFVKQAELDEDHPYFLCLDEMNLARVEYYLSDVLSVIETRYFDDAGKITSEPLIKKEIYGSDVRAYDKYGIIRLPENLYIIGTVNMDETTFPFSRKVLDRANTIEFSYVDIMPDFTVISSVTPLDLPNSFMKAEYIHLAHCIEDAVYVNTICLKIKEINEVLKKANSHVGYRVRDEIVFYMLNNKKAGLLNEDIAFDNEIMQKILPRIQGSSSVVKEMLCELFKICAGDYEGYQTDSETIHKKMFDYINKKECKYKRSAEKIADMVRRFETDGFTQYWL